MESSYHNLRNAIHFLKLIILIHCNVVGMVGATFFDIVLLQFCGLPGLTKTTREPLPAAKMETT